MTTKTIKRVVSKRKLFLNILVLSIILLLSISGTKLTVSAQSSTQKTSPNSILSAGQCFNDNSEVTYLPETGKIRFIGTPLGIPIKQPILDQRSASPEKAARNYLSTCGSLFGLTDQASELQLKRQKETQDGRSVMRFNQTYKGVPIFGAELVVQLNASNDVIMVNGKILPDIKLDTLPTFDMTSAKQTALKLVSAKYGVVSEALIVSEPDLWVYDPGLVGYPGATSLVWLMQVTSVELAPIRELVLVEAQTGTVLMNINQVDTARNRLTYTAGNTTTRPGTLVCNESNPTCSGGDTDAVNAHVYAGDTYDFYASYHGRDSIDNAGMNLISTVHYSSGYCNAFWDGYQMTYGDGCFIVVDDVVAHEMTHGVTANESNLVYSYESGAINESFSDIWGEFVDLTNGKGNDSPEVRWSMGEDTSIGAIRNLKDPTIFSDPDRMGSPYYYSGTGDNGGVHTNSGVGNKAAYLITDGDTFNGYTITGLGITKTAKIYYEAQTNILTSTSDYADLYDALYQACNNLVGTNGITGSDCTQVRNATLATEMSTVPPPPTPPVNDDFDTPFGVVILPYGNSQDTIGATTGVDDPDFTCVSGQKNNSVWYQYNAIKPDTLSIDTFGSNYDTVLAVWTGSRGSLTSIACNDDYSSLQSKVEFSVTAGNTYYIEIASYSPGGGALTLNVLGEASIFEVDSPWTSSSPTMDGLISPGEWVDANSYNITNPVAVTSQNNESLYGIGLERILHEQGEAVIPLANSVTLYAMNNGSYLYLAFDDPNDTTLHAYDQIGVYFDDNPLPSDGAWTNSVCGNPDGEGNFWVLGSGGIYREIVAGPAFCAYINPAPGVVGNFSFESGHAQAEIAIDLESSALRAVAGDSINMHLWILDADTGVFNGTWPLGANFADPSTYNQLNLGVNSCVGTPVLIWQDANPWGSKSNQQVLENNGLCPDVQPSARMGTIDMSDYPFVMIPGDQPTSFYDNYQASATIFTDYVQNGGVLSFSGSAWGWNGGNASSVVLPGGTQVTYRPDGSNSIVNISHPLVKDVPNPFSGSQASHGYFHEGTFDTITKDTLDGPTLIEYTYGNGRVVAFTQPVEYGFAHFSGLAGFQDVHPRNSSGEKLDISTFSQIQASGQILNNLIPYLYSPFPPTNLQASDGTYTDKVQITWSASSGANSYNVYRAGSAGGTKSLLGSLAGTTFNDLTATPGLTYYYWVKACKGAYCSDYSTTNSGWRNLTAPANLQASDGTLTTKVQVTWIASSGANSYKVYRASSSAGIKTLLGSPTGAAFPDTTATPGLTYYYWVKACKGSRCSVYSTANTGWRNLAAPTNLQASDGTYTTKVQLSWTASSGATFYKVYRASSAGGAKTLLGSPVGTTFADTTATPGVTYYYWVKACSGIRLSAFSISNTGWRKP